MVTRPRPVLPVVVVTPGSPRIDPRFPIDPGPVVIPGLSNPSHATSIFDAARRGQVVEERLVHAEVFELGRG